MEKKQLIRMLASNKTILFFILGAGCLYTQQIQSVLLENKILVIKTEGIAFLGSGITENDAKTLAINDAKRNALEQAGTYLESHTEILNYQLVKDEIITYTGGLLKVNVLNEKRALINDMFALKVVVKAAIDAGLLNERIAELRTNNSLRRQLESERERNKILEARIAKLMNSGIAVTKTEIKDIVNALSASDWFKKGLETENLNLKVVYYTNAIQLDPTYAYAYNNRGVTYKDLGDYYAALRDYTSAIVHDSKFTYAYSNRGFVYMILGRYDESIRDCNKAIELDSDNFGAYNNRGSTYYNLGRYEEALREYDKVIELDPKCATAYYNRGVVYEKLGSNRAAAYNFDEYLRIYGNRAEDASKVRQKIRDLGYTPLY